MKCFTPTEVNVPAAINATHQFTAQMQTICIAMTVTQRKQ